MSTSRQQASDDKPEISVDFLAQLRRLLETNWATEPVDSRLRELDAAIDAGARDDIEELVGQLFQAMIAFDARFLARAQYAAIQWLGDWDKAQRNGPALPPKALAEDHLPRLERIERHLMEVLANYGKTMHTIGLAKETEAVRGAARKLREGLRVLAHPKTPQADEAPTPEEERVKHAG